MVRAKYVVGIISLCIILIVFGMLIQKISDKPQIKITSLSIWEEHEEGDEFEIEFCYSINIPAENVYMNIYTEPPMLSLDCFEMERTNDLNVWKIGEPVCYYHTIKVKENLSTSCFREHQLILRLYGMGLEDEKTASFTIIPSDSYFCRRCEDIC